MATIVKAFHLCLFSSAEVTPGWWPWSSELPEAGHAPWELSLGADLCLLPLPPQCCETFSGTKACPETKLGGSFQLANSS